MQINYTTEAFESLLQLINYIESKNTKGAGLRWLQRLRPFCRKNCIHLLKSNFVAMKPLINLASVVFILMNGLSLFLSRKTIY